MKEPIQITRVTEIPEMFWCDKDMEFRLELRGIVKAYYKETPNHPNIIRALRYEADWLEAKEKQ